MPNFADDSSFFSFRTRQSSLDQLQKDPDRLQNVVIIGGGIVGAGLLRELALAGLKDICLFEKFDFASGASGASSKLIHAGIRYLEQVWTHLKRRSVKDAWKSFQFVLQASNERKILGRIAPVLITSKPIYLVLSPADPRSRLSVFVGVWIYYLIQIFQGQFFSPPRLILRKKAIQRLFPALDPARVKAIFSFWDSETDDARLVIENVQSAALSSGRALNYVELLSYDKSSAGHFDLQLKDAETGRIFPVKTRVLVNASGAHIDDVQRRGKKPAPLLFPLVDRVAGSHLNVYPAFTRESFYVTAGDNRLVFVLARNEDGLLYNRIGTTERPLKDAETSDKPRPTPEEVHYLKNLVKEFFPKVELNRRTVVGLDAGIRPLRSQQEQSAFQKSREHDILEEEGLIHIIGVKLTDYRRVAREALERISWSRYGISFPSRFPKDPVPLRLGRKIYKEWDLKQIIEETMVLHWEDYVFRRRGLAPQLLRFNNAPEWNRLFNEMAGHMEWDEQRKASEKRRVEEVFTALDLV